MGFKVLLNIGKQSYLVRTRRNPSNNLIFLFWVQGQFSIDFTRESCSYSQINRGKVVSL
jgi:hypothetical protein